MLILIYNLQTPSCFFADGNGFKTSTMRLGADVVVFSRSCGKDSKRFVPLLVANLCHGFCLLWYQIQMCCLHILGPNWLVSYSTFPVYFKIWLCRGAGALSEHLLLFLFTKEDRKSYMCVYCFLGCDCLELYIVSRNGSLPRCYLFLMLCCYSALIVISLTFF